MSNPHDDYRTDQLPPHSIEAEQGILGCMLIDPEQCIKEFREKVKAGPEVFYDLRHRGICETLVAMHDRREPIDSITISTRLKDRGQLDAVGGGAFLSSLPDAVPSAANFGFYLNVAHEKYTLRRVEQTIVNAKSQLAEHPDKVDAILRGFGDSIHHLRTENGMAWDGAKAKLREILERCRYSQDEPPPLVQPVYSVRTIPLCTRGNLTTAFAAPKAGKSAWLGAMKAAPMVRDESRDTFGITSENPNGFAIVHFDAEQSERDHWEHIERTRIRAGLERTPDWLQSFWITEIPKVEERRDLLRYALEESASRYGGIHSVLLDGAADFVNDVNDQGECNPFVADLHGMASKYAMPVCAIIHLNPNSDNKTRGHLGSQLERKSETNLKLQKDGEVTTVWSEKQRRAPILKDFGPRFQWSTEHGMHMSCQSQADERLEEQREKFNDELDRVFSERKAMKWADLRDEIKNRIRVKKDTAEKRISQYVALNQVRKTVANLYERAT